MWVREAKNAILYLYRKTLFLASELIRYGPGDRRRGSCLTGSSEVARCAARWITCPPTPPPSPFPVFKQVRRRRPQDAHPAAAAGPSAKHSPRSRSPILTRLYPFRSSPPLVMAFLGAGLKTPAPHGPTAPLGNWPPLSLLDLPPLGISWDLLGSGLLRSSLGDAQVGDPVLDGLHRPLLGRARGVARGRVGSHGGSQRFQPRHLRYEQGGGRDSGIEIRKKRRRRKQWGKFKIIRAEHVGCHFCILWAWRK